MLANNRFVIIVPITSDGCVVLYHGKKGWELPGGSIEEGETPEDAAIRELFEECGIKASSSELIRLGTIKSRDGEGYIFSLLIDKSIQLKERAKLFKRIPKEGLAYPLHETMAFINVARTRMLVKGMLHGKSDRS